MKKKIFVIVCFLTMFLTGCDIDYNLNIEDDTIHEGIDVVVEKNILNSNYSSIKQYSYFDGPKTNYYDFSQKEKSGVITLSYKEDYSVDNFKKSRVLNDCYTAFNILEDDNTITISTSKQFKCFVYFEQSVDKINVTIKTNHKVIDHNAKSVSGNTYKWTLENPNADNNIKFVYSKKDTTIFYGNMMTNIIIISSILVGIVIIGIIILLYLKFKNKNVNKI